jgi:hypothetical protein
MITNINIRREYHIGILFFGGCILWEGAETLSYVILSEGETFRYREPRILANVGANPCGRPNLRIRISACILHKTIVLYWSNIFKYKFQIIFWEEKAVESIFVALSITGAAVSMFLAELSFVLPKERIVVHAMIASVFLILFKIALIVMILIMDVGVISRLIVIFSSGLLLVLWVGILYISIIRYKELKKKNK